jgi:hypothetical protein
MAAKRGTSTRIERTPPPGAAAHSARYKMKKRLRKKRHLKEFQELGFEISCRLRDNLTEEEFDKFIDDFIEKAIESHDLIFGGGGDSKSWEGFICHDKRYQYPTEDDRKMIKDWLSSRNEVIDSSVSQLVDAWYNKPLL